jgi:hypothetical protein
MQIHILLIEFSAVIALVLNGDPQPSYWFFVCKIMSYDLGGRSGGLL